MDNRICAEDPANQPKISKKQSWLIDNEFPLEREEEENWNAIVRQMKAKFQEGDVIQKIKSNIQPRGCSALNDVIGFIKKHRELEQHRTNLESPNMSLTCPKRKNTKLFTKETETTLCDASTSPTRPLENDKYINGKMELKVKKEEEEEDLQLFQVEKKDKPVDSYDVTQDFLNAFGDDYIIPCKSHTIPIQKSTFFDGKTAEEQANSLVPDKQNSQLFSALSVISENVTVLKDCPPISQSVPRLTGRDNVAINSSLNIDQLLSRVTSTPTAVNRCYVDSLMGRLNMETVNFGSNFTKLSDRGSAKRKAPPITRDSSVELVNSFLDSVKMGRMRKNSVICGVDFKKFPEPAVVMNSSVFVASNMPEDASESTIPIPNLTPSRNTSLEYIRLRKNLGIGLPLFDRNNDEGL